MGAPHCSGGFIVRDNKYLFGRRSSNKSWYPGTWDIFGGHAEPGESPADTLVRELQEELGIVPVAFKLLYNSEVKKDLTSTMMYYVFVVTEWTGGEPLNKSTEHDEVKWFTRADLETLQLASPEYLQLINLRESSLI